MHYYICASHHKHTDVKKVVTHICLPVSLLYMYIYKVFPLFVLMLLTPSVIFKVNDSPNHLPSCFNIAHPSKL